MANKKLKICIKLVLNDDDDMFYNVNEFKPDHATDMLAAFRKCLNEIYGFNVGSTPPEGFEDTSLNSFQSVDVDVET